MKKLMISGKEVLPLIEGGKGVAVSDGASAGAWAEAGAVGTISGVLADIKDSFGNIIPKIYETKNRLDRQQEMIAQSIKGIISQAKIAYEKSKGNGRIHLNVMWEMGGAQQILEGALKGAKGLINGITCGAGMPFKLGEIAAKHKVFYYPIVSSGRAFKALWSRAYKNSSEFLGGVVYEDPWKAGGHDGFSSSDTPDNPVSAYEKVKELRKVLRDVGMGLIPIIVAGGVWSLTEFKTWIGDPEVGPIAFQLGTRPLLTQESPIAEAWKEKLMSVKEGDIKIQQFSPTGFHSSAVNNKFLDNMFARLETEMPYASSAEGDFVKELKNGIFVSENDANRANGFISGGRTDIHKTPDNTVVFVTPEESAEMKIARANCIGCISQCRFSSFSQYSETGNTGKLPDPRSFCISDSLFKMAHGGDIEEGIMFSGSNGYKFANDELLKDGKIPTVRELIADLEKDLA